MKKVFRFILALALFIMAGLILLLVSESQATSGISDPPTWQPPAIPQCDKELWERIREGCNE